jgi:hypothetical protein
LVGEGLLELLLLLRGVLLRRVLLRGVLLLLGEAGLGTHSLGRVGLLRRVERLLGSLLDGCLWLLDWWLGRSGFGRLVEGERLSWWLRGRLDCRRRPSELKDINDVSAAVGRGCGGCCGGGGGSRDDFHFLLFSGLR